MNTIQTKQSAVINLLQHVWHNAQQSTGHSWLRFNQAMHSALRLAVESGMEFGPDDFSEMVNRFRFGYWCGDTEQTYALAVAYRNTSAWQAYERYRNRKPFIVKDAELDTHYGGGRSGSGLARLVVGARFNWSGERVCVTSFNDELGHVIACSYTQTEREFCDKCRHTTKWPDRKILHRYTITHADIKQARKESKKPDAAKESAA